MAGRRPAPPEVRKAKGSDKRTPASDPPNRVAGIPKPPAHFAGFALECWNEYAELLRKRGQLSKESRVALQALCECYCEWRELGDDLKTHGRFQKVPIQSGQGEMERVRPALAAYQDADRRLKGWLIEFGLTDASRGKVHAGGFKLPEKGEGEPEPAADDPVARYGLN